MTVAELIEKLKAMPQDAVCLYDWDGEYWTPEGATLIAADVLKTMRVCSPTGSGPAVLVR